MDSQYVTVSGMKFYARNFKDAEEIARTQFNSTLKPGQGENEPAARTRESAEAIYARRALEVQAFRDSPPAAANVPGEDDYQRREREKQEAAKR
jgi:hypothetical protein